MVNLPHRWERNALMRCWECVGLPVGGVEDGRRCIGCGITVGDKLVRDRMKGERLGLGWRAIFDMMIDG